MDETTLLISCIIIADIFIAVYLHLHNRISRTFLNYLKDIPFGGISFGCLIIATSFMLYVIFPDSSSTEPYHRWGYCNGKGKEMWSYDRCPNGYPESVWMVWQENVLSTYPLYSLFLTILPYELPLIATALVYHLHAARLVRPVRFSNL
jgi:hypothetical protein